MMISKIKELLNRIEPLLPPQHEEECRKAYYYSDFKQITTMLIIIYAMMFIWLFKGEIEGTDATIALILFSIRIIFIISSIVFIFFQRRSIEKTINRGFLFSLALLLTIQQVLSIIVRPSDYSFTSFTSLILIFVIFFLFTLNMSAKIAIILPFVLFKVMYIISAKTFHDGGKFTIIATLIVFTFICIVYSARSNTGRRKNYLDFIRLQNAKEKMKTMYRTVAHDIRAPFSGLISYSDILESISNSGLKADQARIHDISIKMRELIYKSYFLTENLLEWAGSETNSIKSKKTEFIFQDAVQNSIDLFSPIILQKKIRLVINVSGKTMITEDFRAFSAVARNLVHNAVKFTPVKGKISLSVIQSKNSLALEILNSGKPVSSKIVSEAEKASSGISPDSKQVHSACGMGLEICFSLANRNKWKFGISAIKGKGTLARIVFSIPGKKEDNL